MKKHLVVLSLSAVLVLGCLNASRIKPLVQDVASKDADSDSSVVKADSQKSQNH